jgi:2-amino-4-hydroxy-6-hydroxymethyldihydropteridine diphosphokinase
MRAGIAFGSNMGDRLLMLRQARTCLVASPLLAPPFLTSSVYLTSPVDCPPGSEPFLNAVLEGELTGEPLALLRAMRELEKALGRPAKSKRNAPRCIDMDLLYVGECEMRTEELVLPHPGITARGFVLAPLAEIRPGLVLPGQTETVSKLLKKLAAGDTVEMVDAMW